MQREVRSTQEKTEEVILDVDYSLATVKSLHGLPTFTNVNELMNSSIARLQKMNQAKCVFLALPWLRGVHLSHRSDVIARAGCKRATLCSARTRWRPPTRFPPRPSPANRSPLNSSSSDSEPRLRSRQTTVFIGLFFKPQHQAPSSAVPRAL